MKRLAIITSHPIQYNAPLFQLLAERDNIKIKVFYTWGREVLNDKFDPGFGKKITWDIPLLQGYEFSFINNISKNPGSHHFKGIDNPTLISEIENWGAEALLVYGWSFKSHLKCMRYFHKRLPVFFRGDSTLLQESIGLTRILKRLFLKWVYHYIDIAFYVGTENKKYFKAYGFKEEQLVFAPQAIDNQRFEDKEGSYKNTAIEIRKKLGIAETDFVFLFAGKFEEKKDPLILIKAFKNLALANTHLILVGNGILENELRTESNNCNNIHFLPFQNQTTMPAIYYSCDVFVLPSKGPGETWGLCVNEAMACGKFIIVSNKCGCASDLVTNGKNGFIFNSGNENQLISFMNQSILIKNIKEYAPDTSREIINDWNFSKICIAIENTLI